MNKIRKTLVVVFSALFVLCMALFAVGCDVPNTTTDGEAPANSYSVSVDVNDASLGEYTITGADEDGGYAQGTLVTVTVTPKADYEAEVYVNGEAVALENGAASFSVEADTTVQVKYTYKISASASVMGGEGEVTLSAPAGGSKYESGESVTVTATPAAGYTLKSLSVNGTELTAAQDEDGAFVASFEISEKSIVFAEFVALRTVTIENDGTKGAADVKLADGTPVASGSSVAEGTLLTLTVAPVNGNTVKAVYIAGALTALKEGKVTFAVKGDTEVKVEYDTYYNVSIPDDSDGGEISLTGGEKVAALGYLEGTVLTLTVKVNDGYTLSITKNGTDITLVNDKYTFTVTEAVAFDIRFIAGAYTVETLVNNNNFGSVALVNKPDAGTYAYNSTATFKVTPVPGYVVDYVTVNGEKLTAEPVVENEDDLFSATTYTITVTGDTVVFVCLVPTERFTVTVELGRLFAKYEANTTVLNGLKKGITLGGNGLAGPNDEFISFECYQGQTIELTVTASIPGGDQLFYYLNGETTRQIFTGTYKFENVTSDQSIRLTAEAPAKPTFTFGSAQGTGALDEALSTQLLGTPTVTPTIVDGNYTFKLEEPESKVISTTGTAYLFKSWTVKNGENELHLENGAYSIPYVDNAKQMALTITANWVTGYKVPDSSVDLKSSSAPAVTDPVVATATLVFDEGTIVKTINNARYAEAGANFTATITPKDDGYRVTTLLYTYTGGSIAAAYDGLGSFSIGAQNTLTGDMSFNSVVVVKIYSVTGPDSENVTFSVGASDPTQTASKVRQKTDAKGQLEPGQENIYWVDEETSVNATVTAKTGYYLSSVKNGSTECNLASDTTCTIPLDFNTLTDNVVITATAEQYLSATVKFLAAEGLTEALTTDYTLTVGDEEYTAADKTLKKGDNLTLTLTGDTTDCTVVVKNGEAELKGTDGVYVIENITADITLNITITPDLSVNFPTESQGTSEANPAPVQGTWTNLSGNRSTLSFGAHSATVNGEKVKTVETNGEGGNVIYTLKTEKGNEFTLAWFAHAEGYILMLKTAPADPAPAPAGRRNAPRAASDVTYFVAPKYAEAGSHYDAFASQADRDALVKIDWTHGTGEEADHITVKSNGGYAHISLNGDEAQYVFCVKAGHYLFVIGTSAYDMVLVTPENDEPAYIIINDTDRYVDPSSQGITAVCDAILEDKSLYLVVDTKGYTAEEIQNALKLYASGVTEPMPCVQVTATDVEGKFKVQFNGIVNLAISATDYTLTLKAGDAEITDLTTSANTSKTFVHEGKLFSLVAGGGSLGLHVEEAKYTVTVTMTGTVEDVEGFGYTLVNGADAVTAETRVPASATLTLTVTVPEGYEVTVDVSNATSTKSEEGEVYTITGLTDNVTIAIAYVPEGTTPATPKVTGVVASELMDAGLYITVDTENVADYNAISGKLTIKFSGTAIERGPASGNPVSDHPGQFRLFFNCIVDLPIGGTYVITVTAFNEEVENLAAGANTAKTLTYDKKTYTLLVEGQTLSIKVEEESVAVQKTITGTTAELQTDAQGVYLVIGGTSTGYTDQELKTTLDGWQHNFEWNTYIESGTWNFQKFQAKGDVIVTVTNANWTAKFDITDLAPHHYMFHYSADGGNIHFADTSISDNEVFGTKAYELNNMVGSFVNDAMRNYGLLGIVVTDTTAQAWNATLADIEAEADKVYFIISGTYANYETEALTAILQDYPFDLQANQEAGASGWDYETTLTRTVDVQEGGTWTIKFDITNLSNKAYTAHFGLKDATQGHNQDNTINLSLSDRSTDGKKVSTDSKIYTLVNKFGTAGVGSDGNRFWGNIGIKISLKSEKSVEYRSADLTMEGDKVYLVFKGGYLAYTEEELKALSWYADLQGNDSIDHQGWDVVVVLTNAAVTVDTAAMTWEVKYDVTEVSSAHYTLHFSTTGKQGNFVQPFVNSSVEKQTDSKKFVLVTYDSADGDKYWGNYGLEITEEAAEETKELIFSGAVIVDANSPQLVININVNLTKGYDTGVLTNKDNFKLKANEMTIDCAVTGADGTAHHFNIADLPAGVYTIKLQFDGKTYECPAGGGGSLNDAANGKSYKLEITGEQLILTITGGTSEAKTTVKFSVGGDLNVIKSVEYGEGEKFTAPANPATLGDNTILYWYYMDDETEVKVEAGTFEPYTQAPGAELTLYAKIVSHKYRASDNGNYVCSACGAILHPGDADGITLPSNLFTVQGSSLVDTGLSVSFFAVVGESDWGAHALKTSQNIIISLPNIDPFNVTGDAASKLYGYNKYPAGSEFINCDYTVFLNQSSYITITISKENGISYYKNGVKVVAYAPTATLNKGNDPIQAIDPTPTIEIFAEEFLKDVAGNGLIVGSGLFDINYVHVEKKVYTDSEASKLYAEVSEVDHEHVYDDNHCIGCGRLDSEHTHTFVDGVCSICGYVCAHVFTKEVGECSVCHQVSGKQLHSEGNITLHNGYDEFKTYEMHKPEAGTTLEVVFTSTFENCVVRNADVAADNHYFAWQGVVTRFFDPSIVIDDTNRDQCVAFLQGNCNPLPENWTEKLDTANSHTVPYADAKREGFFYRVTVLWNDEGITVTYEAWSSIDNLNFGPDATGVAKFTNIDKDTYTVYFNVEGMDTTDAKIVVNEYSAADASHSDDAPVEDSGVELTNGRTVTFEGTVSGGEGDDVIVKLALDSTHSIFFCKDGLRSEIGENVLSNGELKYDNDQKSCVISGFVYDNMTAIEGTQDVSIQFSLSGTTLTVTYTVGTHSYSGTINDLSSVNLSVVSDNATERN